MNWLNMYEIFALNTSVSLETGHELGGWELDSRNGQEFLCLVVDSTYLGPVIGGKLMEKCRT
jgi:hypothetical protein